MADEFTERMVARLRQGEDGALSNPKAELYALMLGEGVASKTACWDMAMATPRGNLPSGRYRQTVNQSPALKARVAQLIEERERLMTTGDLRDQMLWQANQLWRRGCAMNDVRLMERATTLLFDLEKRVNPAPKPEKPEPSERGRGAPAVEAPQEEGYTPGAAARDRLALR